MHKQPVTIRPANGFTLVEMSIVLTIIGLLVGGVMGGSYMIKQAELQSVISDLSKYRSAYTQFKTQYDGKPGDIKDATDYWSTDPGGCPTNTTRTPKKETCNGDGDGWISFTNETFRAWQQMSDAGLIDGTFDGLIGASGACCNAVASENVPPGKIVGSAFFIATQGIASGDPNYYDLAAVTDTLYFGGTTTTWPVAPILTPRQTFQIDSKIDDGSPATGSVRAYKSPVDPSCTSADTQAATYLLTTKSTTCSFNYLLQ